MTEELRKEREELTKSNELIRKQAETVIGENNLLKGQQVSVPIKGLEKTLAGLKKYVEKTNGTKSKAEDEELIRIKNDLKQLDLFLNDLFAHTKVSTNTDELKSVSFIEAFREATDEIVDEVKESNASIKCGQLPELRAQHSSMVQMFRLLMSRAIKNRGKEPLEIVANAEEQGDEWIFSVSDTGQGFDPEELEEEFLFHEIQINGHTEFHYDLAMCKNIVERHGGRIWGESSPDGGNTFHFSVKKY